MAFLYCGKTLVAVASNTTAFGHAEINCINSIKQKNISDWSNEINIIKRFLRYKSKKIMN